MKGVSIIAGVIFLALTIAATAIVLQEGLPAVQKLQATAAVEKMKVTLSEFDNLLREVAAGGKGTTRTAYISSDPGKLIINGSTDTILWKLDTVSPIISPRTSQRFGNLVVGSNLETSVEEGNYTRVTPAVPAYIMRNAHLDVYVNKTGSASSQTPMFTNSIVLAIYNKDLDSWIENKGFLDISVDNNANSKSGQGYTQAQELGSNLPFGEITTYMDTTYLDYNLVFRLESGADFLIIEAKEA